MALRMHVLSAPGLRPGMLYCSVHHTVLRRGLVFGHHIAQPTDMPTSRVVLGNCVWQGSEWLRWPSAYPAGH